MARRRNMKKQYGLLFNSQESSSEKRLYTVYKKPDTWPKNVETIL